MCSFCRTPMPDYGTEERIEEDREENSKEMDNGKLSNLHLNKPKQEVPKNKLCYTALTIAVASLYFK